MPSVVKSIALLLLAAVLAGCGGGGGGGASPSSIGLATGGSGSSGGTGGSGGGGSVDSTRPTVTYVTPTNGGSGIAANTKLTIAFSEAMDVTSLGSAITLTDSSSGATVPLQPVAYDYVNNIATVTPQSALTSASYGISISTAAKDLVGNALASAYSWSFSSTGAATVNAPSASSMSPADGETGVGINHAIAVSFSDPMDALTLTPTSFTLSDGTNTVAGSVQYIGQAAVFKPSANLAAMTRYTATLSTQIKSLAGNALAANVSWSFTTGSGPDMTPPNVLSVLPAPNSADAAATTRIVVVFDQPIYPFVYGTLDGYVTTVSIDYKTNTVTMAPTNPLMPNESYTGSVLVSDLAGNAMPSKYVWTFTTSPGP